MTVRQGKKEHPTGEEFKTRLDGVDVDPAAARDAKRFRRIVAARKAAEAAQDDLRAAVRAARGAGEGERQALAREMTRSRRSLF